MSTSRKTYPEPQFHASAYGPENARAHREAMAWMREHPEEALALFQERLDAFDRHHGLVNGERPAAPPKARPKKKSA